MAKRLNVKPVREYTFNKEDDWGCYNEKGRYLKGSFDKDGYCVHMKVLCDDGKHHNLREHNMKWVYFNGEIPEGLVIDHIVPIRNGGTNKLSNLRLVTVKENTNNPLTLDNLSKALKGKYTGEKHWMTGKQHSEETKKKISKWASENQFGEENPFYGKHWNDKQREAFKKAHCRKIKQTTSDGSTFIYDSAADAARKNGFDHSSISKACRGTYLSSHYYKSSEWSYI